MSWAWLYPWCNAHSHFFPGCQQHGSRQREMREPVCPVSYPQRHGAEHREGRWIESSLNPSSNELNKVTELDEIVPLTFGPAVSALEAVTSWLCFRDRASGLRKEAGSQLPLPRAGRGAGGRSLQDKKVGLGISCTPQKVFIFHYFDVIWASRNLFQGKDDTVKTTCNIFQATFPLPAILKEKLIIYYWHLPPVL